MIDRHELEKMFDEFDGNIILMSPSHYKEFVNRFLDYHYNDDIQMNKNESGYIHAQAAKQDD